MCRMDRKLSHLGVEGGIKIDVAGLIEFKRLACFGSDHFPVFIKLSFEPDAESQQPQLQATGEEEERAAEKIEKAA